MRKILIVDIGPTSGGIETLIDSVYDRLDKNEYHIDFLIYGDRCFNEEKYALTGNIYKVSRRYEHPVRHLMEIRDFFRKGRDYDVIWIQTKSASNVNAHKYARKYTNAMIITHSHISKPETKNAFHNLVASFLITLNKRTLISCTDYAIGCSKDAYKYMFGKAYKGAGSVIINGVDLNRFRFDAEKRRRIRNEYRIPEGAALIGHVGRMVPVKNHTFVVDVFASLQKRLPSSFLMFIGDGPERQALEQYVHRNGLEDNVIFAGEVRNVSEYLSAFDVFMFPSFFEGLSLAVIEAQVSGLPTFFSERIPKDAKATANAYRLSLEAEPDRWAEEIAGVLRNQSPDRTLACDALTDSPYDIENTVKELEKILRG